MGTLDDIKNMMNLLAHAGIEPDIGSVLPMERAEKYGSCFGFIDRSAER